MRKAAAIMLSTPDTCSNNDSFNEDVLHSLSDCALIRKETEINTANDLPLALFARFMATVTKLQIRLDGSQALFTTLERYCR